MSPQAENVQNLVDGYYPRLMFGKDTEWINCYVHGQYPASAVGSYYGELLAKLDNRGGLAPFDHERDAVFTGWDLGHSDSTSIWFWRINDKRQADFIDHYESNGQPMSHYFDLLERWSDERGYKYHKHWLPHDARAKTLQTGESILDQCLSRWGAAHVAIVPRLSLEDGVQASRWLLEQDIRIHPRCSEKNNEHDTDGVECLRQYHKKWDEKLKTFKNEPVHDLWSHSADGFRYAATVIKMSEFNTRPKPPTPLIKVPDINYSFTLEDLHKWRREATAGRRRV
jgi:hypothetical protein